MKVLNHIFFKLDISNFELDTNTKSEKKVGQFYKFVTEGRFFEKLFSL